MQYGLQVISILALMACASTGCFGKRCESRSPAPEESSLTPRTSTTHEGWRRGHEVVALDEGGELEPLGTLEQFEQPPTGMPWGVRAAQLDERLALCLDELSATGLWLTDPRDHDLTHVKTIRSLTLLSIDSDQISDAGLKHLAGLSKLETLIVGDWPGCPKVTDRGLSYLEELKSLRTLRLRGTQAGGDGLRFLAGLDRLTTLDLERTPLSQAGLDHLVRLKNLRCLDLTWTGTTDDQLQQLTQLNRLQTLVLKLCPITDDGLRHVPAWSQLESLQLEACEGISDRGLRHLAGAVNLKNLDIDRCEAVTDAGLLSLAGLSGLRQLQLEGTRVTRDGLRTVAELESLTTLSLGGEHVSGIGRLERAPVLTSLSLSNEGVRSGWIEGLSGLKKLTELRMVRCYLTDERLRHLQNLTKLQSVRIFDCNSLTGRGLEVFAGAKSLRRLEVSGCDSLDDSALKSVAGMNQLLSLDFWGSRRISGSGLRQLAGLQNLRSLNLGECHRIGDLGLRRLHGLRNLRYLRVWNCPKITTRAIDDLQTTLPGCFVSDRVELGDNSTPFARVSDRILARMVRTRREVRELDLSGPDRVSDRGLAYLEEHPTLQALRLENCQRVSDEGLRSVGRIEGLKLLSLRNCRSITSRGVGHLARLLHLTDLDLSGCDQVTDEGVRCLGGLRELQVLRLRWLDQLGDASLEVLGDLPNLKVLDLRGCAQVTDEGVLRLAALPGLLSLNLLECARVSKSAADRLAEEMPGCSVAFSDSSARWNTAANVARTFEGSVSWFCLGGDVYHEGDAELAQEKRLDVEPEQRWFGGKGPIRHPSRIPIESETLQLELQAVPLESGDVQLIITLNAFLPVKRSVQHRRTNVLPLLFAFAVDRRSIKREPANFKGLTGGIGWDLDLIAEENGGAKRWEIIVSGGSLSELLPDGRNASLFVIAAFADNQHYKVVWVNDKEPESETGRLVRSEPVELLWDGNKFSGSR